MKAKPILLLLLSFLLARYVDAQNSCTTLGQTPATAFPVCGTAVFKQTTVPTCANSNLTVPGCPASVAQDGYQDKNPFWYAFTCYTAGSLGFVITPLNPDDDYDWQLYDITGHDPQDVFTNSDLVVTGNWSGSYGITGAETGGSAYIQCASSPADHIPTFSNMPVLTKGHKYLLLISHYTDSQSGYTLSFGGGTGSITDTTKPRMSYAMPSCDATTLQIQLNKKVNCSSLAADGSDFTISPAGSPIVAATGNTCSTGFDLNLVTLNFGHALPVGDYVLTIQNGHDGNTLSDYCGNAIFVGDTLHFTIPPFPPPTPLDSIGPPGCAPQTLNLYVKKNIRCSSIANDGSDFIITGTNPLHITGASGSCSAGVTKMISIALDAPVLAGGNYQITLVKGIDGNTLIDDCGQQTPEGSSLTFATADTVSARFTYTMMYGCVDDTVLFDQPGGNGINNWQWQFGDGQVSNLQNPVMLFPPGPVSARLTVSNGVCSDTASGNTILLDNVLKAGFSFTDSLCPTDKAIFTDTSVGRIINWNWDFGDGTSSSLQNPDSKNYPNTGIEKNYTISLIVENTAGCSDTLTHMLKVLRSCYIEVPTAFTPNGDFHNDFLYPLNAYKATNLEFRIFNRYGQMVFETKDWTKKWDGTINGKPQDTGTYVWTLRYRDKESGKQVSTRGTTVLIR